MNGATASTLTVESALQASGRDPLAALEAVVQERNNLTSQNAQLWKLFEKQRAMYNSATKELDRLRALVAQPSTSSPVASKEKEPHTASEKTSVDTSSSPSASKRPDRPDRAEARDKPPRDKLSRSNSEDQYAQKYLGTSGHSLSPSRSHEPLNGSPLRTATATAVNPPEASTSSTGSSTPQKPNRGESLPAPAATVPLNVQKKASLPAPSTKSQLASAPPVPVIVSEDVSNTPNVAAPLSQSPASASSASSQPSTIPPMLYPSNGSGNGDMLLTAPAPRDRRGARESRITLPDEAARYIAAMGESPSGSPKPNLAEFGSTVKGGDPHETIRGDKKNDQADVATETEPYSIENSPVEEKEVAYPVVSNERKAPNYPPPPPPGTASSTSTVREVHKHSASRSSSVDYNDATTPMPNQTSYGHQHHSPQQWQPSKPPVYAQDANGSTPVLGGFDRPSFAHQQSSGSVSFPSPMESEPATPAQSSAHHGKQSESKERRDTRERHAAPQQSSAIAYNDPQFYDTGASPSSHSKRTRSPATAASPQKSTQPHLSPQDLPSTRVHIAGSQIRSNERGKEVLSFVISVHPVRIGSSATSEEWKIEKMYSDILALDGKVRGTLGRSQAKRLPPLPDAKLFKDNAPAKVDQRRAILEQYLQALLVVPTKDTSDICFFFSSDLSRGDRAPMASQGYKEGYLTKRGKNFGGWRTRYFVLQNSVLEYFENRGGAHLGTINITGAQIGRQQKQANADDENAYRHAFLIIEQTKKGAVPSRHVLCAASDTERDEWVDVLVRSIAPSYGDDTHSQADTTTSSTTASRPSTSSNAPSERPGVGNSPIDRPAGQSQPWTDAQLAQRMIDRNGQGGTPIMSTVALPNSLPSSLESSGAAAYHQPRSDSSAGHYGESSREQRATLQPSSHHETTSKSRSDKSSSRTSHHPSISTLKSSHASASSAADRGDDSSAGESTTAGSVMSGSSKKISGPLNAQPIPPGQVFGSKAADTSDRERKAKSGRFWPNFGKSANHASGSDRPPPSVPGSSPANGQPGRMVFGVPLEQALAVAQIANLPAIVFRCIEYLEAKKAAEEEGIYRLNGSSAVIKSLKDRFNYEGDVDLLKHDEYWDPHAIAGLLKQFLRDMPTTILTRELQPHFLSVVDLMDPKERVNELAHLVSQLPVANYSLLRAMTAHLILIVQNATVNKMTMRNIGIVFSPTLGIPAGILSLMLGEFDPVFNVDATDTASDVTSSNEHEPYESQNERTPQKGSSSSRATQRSSNNSHERINKRNSMLYANTATDRMLGLAGRKLDPSAEDSSDGDEVSIPEESDEETDRDVEQTGSGSPPSPAPLINISSAPGTDPQMHGAKAIAANRGLQISVSGKKMNRTSGLPSSPRPMRYPGSPGATGPTGAI